MYDESMAEKMPPEVLEYLRSVGKAYGKVGGKVAAGNMTPEERTARARKASEAAVRKRAAARSAGERTTKPAKRK